MAVMNNFRADRRGCLNEVDTRMIRAPLHQPTVDVNCITMMKTRGIYLAQLLNSRFFLLLLRQDQTFCRDHNELTLNLRD